MLKRNALKRASAIVFSVALALFFTLFFSCKSVPKAEPVDLYSLVSPDASFYIYLPVKYNADFAKKVFCAKITGLSEKDAQQIVSRTDSVVLAIGINNDFSSFQIASSGNYPLLAVQASLTESNGWKRKTFSPSSIPYTYFQQRGGFIQISVPSSVNAIISNDVCAMISNYENAVVSQVSDKEIVTANAPACWNEGTYSFLTEGKPESIMFYAAKPAVFVKDFLSKDIKLGIETMSGSMTQNAKDGIFNLELNVKLSDPRTMKAALAMLKIALFPVPAEIVQVDPNSIKITSVTITWDGLLDLLTR